MKVILITGASRGIGFESGRRLAEAGNIVIFGCRNLEAFANKKPLFENIYAVKLDVTLESDIQNVCSFVRNKFGRLDILINNAGIGESEINKSSQVRFVLAKIPLIKIVYNELKPFLKRIIQHKTKSGALNISLNRAKTIMDTNFYGAWRMCQVFVPLLKCSENAQIINVSSGMGLNENLSSYLPAYSLSKASLNSLSIILSKELSSAKIKVNAVCPGWVRTDMGGPDAPLDVSEGADTIVWLASNNNIETGKFFKNRQILNW